MNLLFLWKKQKEHSKGFNFSSDYNISYDEETKRLEIERTPSYTKCIFNEYGSNLPEINDITAIIGKNGAGKTTLFRWLLDLFSNTLHDAGFVIYKYNETIYVKLVNLNPQDAFDDLGSLNISNADFSKELSVIYLSNVFNIFESEKSHNGIKFLSNNQLMYKHLKNHREMSNVLYPREPDTYSVYSYEEFRIQLEFINFTKTDEHLCKVIPFKLPNAIIVQDSELRNLIDQYNKDFEKNNSKSFFYTNEEVWRYINGLKSDEKTDPFGTKKIHTADTLLKLLFLTFVRDEYIFTGKSCVTLYLEKNKESIMEILNSDNGINEFFKHLNKAAKNSINEFSKGDQKKLKSIREWISHIFTRGFSGIYCVYSNMDHFLKMYDLYRCTYDYYPYLKISWAGISSGEAAWLTLYSRLFSISDFSFKNDEIINERHSAHNILLLVDEGEVYMHPEWQRGLIYDLIRFVRRIFKYKEDSYLHFKNGNPRGKQRKIHIVLTSNSPFLLSDLPKNHCLFLENTDSSIKQIPTDTVFEQNENSFGGNIHELMMKPFFMKYSIGKFAQHVITDIVTFLKSDIDYSTKQKDDCLKKIILIGEPVIRGKLLSMLYDRFPEMERRSTND